MVRFGRGALTFIGVVAVFAGALLALRVFVAGVDGADLRDAVESSVANPIENGGSLGDYGLEYITHVDLEVLCPRPATGLFGASVSDEDIRLDLSDFDAGGSIPFAAFRADTESAPLAELVKEKAVSACTRDSGLRLTATAALLLVGFAAMYAGVVRPAIRRGRGQEPAPPRA